MKLILQRVSKAHVEVNHKTVGRIGPGLLIFLGIGKKDTEATADYFINKILQLRLFSDAQGKMNLAAGDVGAEILVVSQFTLYGNCGKGRRPSFDKAGPPKLAEDLYNYFVEKMKQSSLKVATGVFRAMMDVHLVNDGPVTFILEDD